MFKQIKVSLLLIISTVAVSILTSCSYEITVADISSLIGTTWNFNDTSSYDYNENYVEIANGRAQLKTLDLEHSGEDFNNGTHVGSSANPEGVNLLAHLSASSTHVNTVLPGRAVNLIGYWRMDDDFRDSSLSGNDGTPFGDTVINQESKVGESSASFDGSGDFISLSSDPTAGLTQLTVSGWVKSSGSGKSIIGAFTNTSDTSILAFFNSTSRLAFRIDTTTNSSVVATSTDPKADDQWHFFVGTYNGSEIKLYIDGIQDGPSIPITGPISSSSDPFEIGRYFNADSTSPNGLIDELAIWNIELTSSEVKSLYEAQNANFTELSSAWTPKWSNIVGYWKMDGNWQDSSGIGNHGSPVNSPNFDLISKVGSHSGSFEHSLSGFGDYIQIPANPSFQLSGSVTICSWVNPLTFDETGTIVRNGSSTDLQYMLGISSANPGRLFFQVYDGTFVGRLSNKSLQINSWSYVCVMRNSSNSLNFYINGELDQTSSVPQEIGGGGDLFIGGHSGTAIQDFNGYMDDLAIWNVILSGSDIKNIYNRQKQKYASHYDSEVIDMGTASSNWPNLSWSTLLPFGKELVGDFDNDGSSDSESSSDYSGILQSLSNGLTSSLSFNEIIEDSVQPGNYDFNDSSGNISHGQVLGSPRLGEAGIISRSMYFDGVNDYVDLNSTPKITSSFNADVTFSLWLKLPSTQTDTSGALNRILFRDSPSGFDSLVVRNQTDENAGKIDFRRSDGSASVVLLSNQLLDDNEYHNIFVVKNGATLYLYIDGVLDSQIADNTSLNENFSLLRIGGAANGNLPFEGALDEFSSWERALSEAEIQQLYRRGANRIKLQVKSCVDSTCECKSFNAAPAGSATDCDGDGILNALDHDDIHKSEFIGPGGDGTTYYSELYNRSETDITFQCALNTTDSHPGICVPDEITLAGSPKPTGPEFLDIDYTQFVKPQNNRYAQYRVYMEADENTACGGEPCLPELTSVSLNPTNTPKYYGEPQVIKPLKPQPYKSLDRIVIDADPCVRFQLSPNDTQYYWWDGSTWSLATDNTLHLSTKEDVQDQIKKFSSQLGPGNLHIKAYLFTNADQTAECSIGDFDVFYK